LPNPQASTLAEFRFLFFFQLRGWAIFAAMICREMQEECMRSWKRKSKIDGIWKPFQGGEIRLAGYFLAQVKPTARLRRQSNHKSRLIPHPAAR
jgi:hypothetical protein